MTMPEGASSVLLRARDLLVETNWVQDAMFKFRRDGRLPVIEGYCPLGALREVCPDPVQRYVAEVRLADVIKTLTRQCVVTPSEPWAVIAIWNDEPERTKHQVLQALEEAAR